MNSIKDKGSFEIPPEPKAPAASKADQKVSPETPKLSPDQEAAVKEKLKEKSSEDVSVPKKIIGKDVTDFSTTGPVSDKIQQTISKLTGADSKPEISSVDAEISSGHVQKMKSELGLKTPEYSLGSKVPAKAVELHRHPKHVDNREFTFKDFNDTALTNKHAAAKLKELINEYKAANGKDPGPREMSKLKEQATQWAFDTYMQGNIDLGLYNPNAMGAEIKRVLGVDDFIPAKINDLGSAMDAIEEELNKFNVPVFLEGRKQSQVLTNELHQLLMHDIKKAMKLYMKVYPDKTWEDAFVFCRDMARNAVYQVIFDKRTFTGSDHGVLHVHHNVQNGDHMHEHMDEGDMSEKAQFLSQVMHFYHDIGYSVGAGKDFNVMKDHPFIGAAFIEANRDYFEHYMGKEETDILKTSILYHAIVSFDSKVGDDLAMVRFTTSNSDACAVAADQKTQSFWREHPETLLSLAKLKLFLTIYPEYASRDKLSHSDIMAHPEKVLDFNNPYDLKAWNVFKSVRDELIAIANQRHLPKEEKEAFVAAIKNNFNAFSGEVVLGQYGAELVDVSVVANPQEAGPKYLPAVKMAPHPVCLFRLLVFNRSSR